MSFSKAEQLIELATLAASRHMGITLDDVVEAFPASTRTAQRMMRALESRFPETEAFFDDDGRKRWRLRSATLRDLMTLTAEETAALELAVKALSRSGNSVEATHLKSLKQKILALVPRSQVARLETDHEALLEAQGLATRPGPRPLVVPEIASAVAEAIKACQILEIVYRTRGNEKPKPRRVAPYGILSGLRRYLLARDLQAADDRVRMFRFEAILSAKLAKTSFTRPPTFDLRRFASRAFGSYQNEQEYGEVVWRFAPEAADHARGFEFHPDQSLEEEADGSLIVRFHAAGHLEMCWHLYAWGDKVEVLEPQSLRKMCHRFRRGDFAALP